MSNLLSVFKKLSVPQKQRKGFAAMDKEKARAIQSMGGKSSHGGGRPRKVVSHESF